MLLLHIFKLFSSNFMFAGHRPWKPQLANQPEGTIDGQCFSGHAVTEASSIYRKSDINFTVESHVFFCVASDGCRKKEQSIGHCAGVSNWATILWTFEEQHRFGKKGEIGSQRCWPRSALVLLFNFQKSLSWFDLMAFGFWRFLCGFAGGCKKYLYNLIFQLKFSMVVFTIHLDIFQSS